MSNMPNETHKDDTSALPGENILQALMTKINHDLSAVNWDKGHGPDYSVYHDTHYHDHNQGSPWSQSSPWPRA